MSYVNMKKKSKVNIQSTMFDIPANVQHNEVERKTDTYHKMDIESLGLNSVYKDFGNYIKSIRPNKV